MKDLTRELLNKEITKNRELLITHVKHLYDVYGDGYPFTGSQYIHDMSDSCTFRYAEEAHTKLGQLLLALDKYDNNGKEVGYMDL